MDSIRIFFTMLVLCLYSTFLRTQNVETLVLRPGPEDGFDAEIRTDANYPIWDNDDFIANAWTAGGEFFIQRSLIKFDLSMIPPGSEIVGARLSLFCNTSTGHHQLHSGENASFLLRITSGWDQNSLSWANQPATTTEDAIILPQSQTQTQDYLDIEVSDQIRYFYHHPEQNFGFMIKLVEEEMYRAMIFGSSNHPDPGKRPLLEIDYIRCIDPDTNYTYSMHGDRRTVEFDLEPEISSQYWWDFGNGYYSDKPQPTFTFQETGEYNVCLTVSNPCDTLTSCKKVLICDLAESFFTFQISGTKASFFVSLTSPEVNYFWNFGDGFFSYLPEPVHIYNFPGQYTVCLTISNECNQTQYCDTINILPAGIDVDNYASLVSVFPNPGKGLYIIKNLNQQKGINKVMVTNIDGRIVFSYWITGIEITEEEIELDLSDQNNGIYILHLATDAGLIKKKLILLK